MNAIPITEMTKPAAVVLDDEGNAIDQATGRQIQIAQRMPTLKVNIREKKKEQLKFDADVLVPQEDEKKHFDPRMGYIFFFFFFFFFFVLLLFALNVVREIVFNDLSRNIL